MADLGIGAYCDAGSTEICVWVGSAMVIQKLRRVVDDMLVCLLLLLHPLISLIASIIFIAWLYFPRNNLFQKKEK